MKNVLLIPELYSVVKLVRKQGGYSYNTPSVLSHNKGILFEINVQHNYVDVIYNDKKKCRNIRMFMNNDGIYHYHDNDNNTEIYLYKTISKKLSPKWQKYFDQQLGCDYDLGKMCIQFNVDELFLYAQTSKSIHGIYNYNNNYYHNHTKELLKLFGNLGGFTSREFLKLGEILIKNIKPTTLELLVKNIDTNDLNDLQNYNILKNKNILKQKYEKVAKYRELELDILKKYQNNEDK